MNDPVPPEMLAQAIEFGLPSNAAEACMRKNNNDISRALEYYFSGDYERDLEGNRWDEHAWTADRYGPAPNPASNTSQAADTVLRDPVGAISRPPSPSKTFQIDRTIGDEDPELQQAINNSMTDTHKYAFTGPQATGTVGYTPNSNFKRADIDMQYDQNNWAVTVRGEGQSHAMEIFLDPSAKDRKRVPDQPAFLRPSTGSGNLGPLLTILHSIPAARETLLQRDHLLESYGENENWWTGHVIQLPKIVVEDELEPIPPEKLEVIRESQRLMAFLTGTERAYGTAESLATMPGIFDADPGALVSNYFTALGDAIRRINHSQESVRTALQSKAVRVTQLEGRHCEKFEAFDITVKTKLLEQNNSTLYDAIDTVFGDEWETEIDGTEIFAEYFGEVCTIQVRSEDPQRQPCGIDIPAELYLDRYTEEFKGHVSQMRKMKAGIQAQIEELYKKEQKIRLYSPMFKPNSTLDMMTVIEMAKKYFERTKKYLETSANKEFTVSGSDISDADQVKKCSDVAGQLAEIEARIQKKIDDLQTQRKALRDKLDELKALFTSPDKTVEGAPELKKYLLRGVSTDRGVTYLRREKLVPHINLEIDDAPTEIKKQYEWWSLKYHTVQLAYSEESYGSYELKAVTEEEVLRAAKYEGQGLVLLVYAKETSDEKETIELEDLPSALQQFVARDNELFAKEVVEAASKPASYNKKRPHTEDWNTDKPYANREFYQKWNNIDTTAETGYSSRAATPGDSRRNSFDMGDIIDRDEDLKMAPKPPGPPGPTPTITISTAPGPSVHFAMDVQTNQPDSDKGFQGAYGSRHEVMAVDDEELEEGKLRQKEAANDTDDETAGDSEHIEFSKDGTLVAAPMPVPPPPPQHPAPKTRFALDD